MQWGTQMKKVLGKVSLNWIWILLSAATLAFACLTLHDMQTSEGVGLYLSMQAGKGSQGLFDVLVDGAGMLCLSAVILLPCMASGYRRPDSFLRLLSAYLAFLPTISLASLAHLLDGSVEIGVSGAVRAGNWEEAFREGLGGNVFLLAAGVPLLILAEGLLKEGAQTSACKKLSRRLLAGICGGGLLLGAIFFPALTEQCSYFFHYLILIYGFAAWERLYEREPKLKIWGMILFGIFWLRGMYRMIEVMSLH